MVRPKITNKTSTYKYKSIISRKAITSIKFPFIQIFPSLPLAYTTINVVKEYGCKKKKWYDTVAML